MPVVTRKMLNMSSEKSIKRDNGNNISEIPSDIYILFMQEIKHLMELFKITQDKETKMQIILDMFKNINTHLKKFLSENPSKWSKFAATTYNKTTEFLDEMISGNYSEIYDTILVDKLYQELMEARIFLTDYLKKLIFKNPWLINNIDKQYEEAYNNFDKEIYEKIFIQK